MSSNTTIREAVVIIADRIRNNEIANITEALIEAAGGPEEYVWAAVHAAQRKDHAGVKRNARDASSMGAMVQMEIPGLDHAAFPFWVERKGEDGDTYGIPPSQATLDEVDTEVRRLEQNHAVRGRVIGGYRATVERLRELGVTGDTTGAEIEAMFPRELED